MDLRGLLHVAIGSDADTGGGGSGGGSGGASAAAGERGEASGGRAVLVGVGGAEAPPPAPGTGLTGGHGASFENIAGDVRELHRGPKYAGSVFQVASQVC